MKLKDDDLKEIAKLIDDGWSYRKLAVKFRLGKSSMYSIVSRYRIHGIDGILHKGSRTFTIEEKIAIINRYYAGESKSSLAIEINARDSLIIQWVKKYEQMGYNGLIDNRGKPGVSKMRRPKKNKTLEQQASTTEVMEPLTDVEREELNNLRKQVCQQQMEIDCLKKIQALVQQRQNRQTKKK